MGNGERESKLINNFSSKVFKKKNVMHVRVWELSRAIKQICEYLKLCEIIQKFLIATHFL